MEPENQSDNLKEFIPSEDAEISAIGTVYNALKGLDAAARARVLAYVGDKLGNKRSKPQEYPERIESSPVISTEAPAVADDELDGISPAGRKWITRNAIDPSKLMNIFSLGIDEIDLISQTVPGDQKPQRMRNIFLLKGIASYLGTGVARITHEQVKEACLHYNSWDGNNFAKNFKIMAPIVSGTKEAGYTLTAKGLAEGTALVKGMIAE